LILVILFFSFYYEPCFEKSFHLFPTFLTFFILPFFISNHFFKSKKYDRFQKSAADAVVFQSLKSKPDSKQYPHAARWYNHIASFGDKIKSFPGTAKDLSAYGPAGSTTTTTEKKAEAAPAEKKAEKEDDDFELFGSDDEEEDAAAEELKQQRLKEYNEKKAAKPKVIAKSSILLDIKPWDDETDLKELEKCVRSIECDGLLWGASKLVPVAFGIKKLQILCTVEDDKVLNFFFLFYYFSLPPFLFSLLLLFYFILFYLF